MNPVLHDIILVIGGSIATVLASVLVKRWTAHDDEPEKVRADLTTKIAELRVALTTSITNLHTQFAGDILEVRTVLVEDITEVRKEVGNQREQVVGLRESVARIRGQINFKEWKKER